MAKRYDFDGDGLAEIPVVSPWGLGLLEASGTTLASSAMVENGHRLGEWLLNTRDNRFGPAGDFDGDGREELFVTSPWGVGILKRTGSGWGAPFLTPNGSRIGGWVVDTRDNRWYEVGDLDGDGRDEILVTSPWGLGVFRFSGTALAVVAMLPNGARIGDWLLNTADNSFGPVADFDGDGRREIVVTSPWGLGIFKLNGGTLSTLMMAPNGSHFGGWSLDTTKDRFVAAGDLDGDGRAELLVAGPGGIAVLRAAGSSLTASTMVANDGWIGHWRLNTTDNRFGPVADFDGDGKAEILVASPWGIGLLKWSEGALGAPWMAENGARLGDWRLNSHDNRFNLAADWDGDGKAEVLITSPWGAGLLNMSGQTPRVSPMAPNGTRLGDWLLNTADNDLEMASADAHAVLIYHNDWSSGIEHTRETLRRRGFTVHTTDKASTGLALLHDLERTVRPGDRLFVYLAGHGSDPRSPGDTSASTSLEHFVQFNDGTLYLKQVAPLFEAIGNHGADLTVLDGSCNGGETVLGAAGKRYCAMATTSVMAPGLTNFPEPADALQREKKPSTFGLWWADPHLCASWLNGAIIRGVPSRAHQRLYRNDVGDLATWAVFIRPAVDSLKILDLGGWNLRWQYCHLFQYIYPDDYKALPADEQAKFTNDTQTFLDAMRAVVDPLKAMRDRLRQTLGDQSLITRAAAVYVGGFTRAWQTLAGDPDWDPQGEPQRHAAEMCDLSPSDFTGEQGFVVMVNAVLDQVAFMESCYEKQEELLRSIDAAAQAAGTGGLIRVRALHARRLPLRRPGDPRYYREFNRMESELLTRHRTLLRAVPTLPRRGHAGPTALSRTRIDAIKRVIKVGPAATPTLADLVAEFKAISVEHMQCLALTSFLLSLVEDAIGAVQSEGRTNPGDVNYY